MNTTQNNLKLRQRQHRERLVDALIHLRSVRASVLLTRPFICATARRYWVNPRTLETAIKLMIAEEN